MLLSLMTTFLFTAVWRWECRPDRLLPRKREAPGVFASIILFLTQWPYSAVVVRFSNSRCMRGAGRKKSHSACQLCVWAFKGSSFMCVTYGCFCVDGISGRETLPQHIAAVTQNTDGGSGLVHFPWSAYLHRWLYSALMCVFLCSVLSVSGETYGCCSGVY